MDTRKNHMEKNKLMALTAALALYIIFAGVAAVGFYAAISRGDKELLLWMIVIFGAATVAMAGAAAIILVIFSRAQRALMRTVEEIFHTLPESERNVLKKLADDDESLAARIADSYYHKQREVDSLRLANSTAVAEMTLGNDIYFEICGMRNIIRFGPYWEDKYGASSIYDAKTVEQLLTLETQISFRKSVENLKDTIGAGFTIPGQLKTGDDKAIAVTITAASTAAYDETMIIGCISDVEHETSLAKALLAERKMATFLLESVDEVIYETDMVQNQLTVLTPEISKAMFGMSSLTDFDSERRPYWERIHPDYREGFIDRFFNYDHLMVLPGHRLSYEYRVKNAEGDYIWVEHTIWAVDSEKSRALKVLGRIRDINEQKRRQFKLLHKSCHDSLTGALLKSALSKQFDEQVKAEPHRRRAVLLFDINGFRYINRQYGHGVGDKVLRRMTNTLWKKQLASCLVGRGDDDMFIVAMLTVSDTSCTAEKQMQAVLDVFAEPIKIDNETINITVSAGSAALPGDGGSFEALYDKALTAMRISREKSGPFTNNGLPYSDDMGEAEDEQTPQREGQQ